MARPSKPKPPARPVRPSTTPQSGIKLPHERDESAEQDEGRTRGANQRPVIEQGASDVESGQRDTDCYTATEPRYRKHERRGG